MPSGNMPTASPRSSTRKQASKVSATVRIAFGSDPKAMRTVADTFEACFRVLERGEAVGIFPEGITYNDSQLKEVKTGAARMALELENRHQGRLGLQIVP